VLKTVFNENAFTEGAGLNSFMNSLLPKYLIYSVSYTALEAWHGAINKSFFTVLQNRSVLELHRRNSIAKAVVIHDG